MYISNVDSLFFSIDIKDFEEHNKTLLQVLAFKKDEAKADTMKEVFLDLGIYKFHILPNGLRFHAYILHNENLSISISQARSKSKNNYPVAIRIKSIMLWQYGYIEAYTKTMEIIQNIFKGIIIDEKISRADLCCHIDNLNITASDFNNFRGNFKKNELFFTNRKLTGITFGTFTEKNCMLRIYDKSLEIKTSGKTWFNLIWTGHDMDIENVWNVEFQVGRTFFKEHNIETIQDFILKARAIWEKLTTEYCCLIIPDDSNISRCSTNPIWLELQQSYNTFIKTELIKREKQMRCRADELLPLLTGVLLSYGACNFNLSIDDTLEDFKNALKVYLAEKKDNADINKLLFDRMQYIYS